MDWWHKIRKTWNALSTRIKLRKPAAGVAVAGGQGGGGVGEYGGGGGDGLLKLKDDVQMCGYRDVEVMWNMLSISLQPQQMETERRTKSKLPQRSCKQRSISRFFLWTNHGP